jgi:hypothetical protein
MMENLPWLFYAYGAGWALTFLYLVWIGRKEQSLRRRVAELQERIEDRWTRK